MLDAIIEPNVSAMRPLIYLLLIAALVAAGLRLLGVF
jgi:hypothetical protein